MDALAEMIQSF